MRVYLDINNSRMNILPKLKMAGDMYEQID